MIFGCSSALRIAAIAVIATPLLAAQASASGMNEYTLSPSETGATVTSYSQDTYQTQTYPSQTQTQVYQPQVQAPADPQFGEILFDTQPYMPDAQNDQTGTYALQPYTGETSIEPYQPAPSIGQPIYTPSVTN